MYATPLMVDVPVDLMARLDGLARARRMTRSELVRGALAEFAGMEIHTQGNRNRNRDGKANQAEEIIRANPKATITGLMGLMKAADCARGKNWVADRRRNLAKGATPTSE